MVTITILYPYCPTVKVMNECVTGMQPMESRDTAVIRVSGIAENIPPHASPQGRREEILRAHEERSRLHRLARTFGVSRYAVIAWMKKSNSTCPSE